MRPSIAAAAASCLLCCQGVILAPAAQPKELAQKTPPPPPVQVPGLPPPPQCHDAPSGATWVGLGGQRLEADRVNVDLGADRMQLQQYLVWSDNVSHHIAILGEDLFTSDVASTFGGTGPYGGEPSDWFQAPSMGPLVLFTTFRIAFAVCHRLLADPPWWVQHPEQLASPPTAAAASERCTGWMLGMWAREPTQDQVDACVELLTVDAAEDPDPVRQWSYGCAAVFTAIQENAD